jgi:hypothetical protein
MDDWGSRDREAPEAASGEPQLSQNRAVASSTGAPHVGHAAPRVAPHPLQKRAPARTALPQDGQGAPLAVTA